MIAGRLTMRAALERDTATAKDGWGGPVAPVFASTGDPLPCFAWTPKAYRLQDGQKTAEITDYRAMFALGADVQPGDEISAITDRTGNVLIPGRLQVQAPIEFQHTHFAVNLRRIA